ncbi:hypothetical protein [Pelotomaculum propionicicum]|uniref:hypothetical protein n=1 Tax=Pelotomaculum propionicicum TaxID=258475 RepID=UPI003B9F5A3A
MVGKLVGLTLRDRLMQAIAAYYAWIVIQPVKKTAALLGGRFDLGGMFWTSLTDKNLEADGYLNSSFFQTRHSRFSMQ